MMQDKQFDLYLNDLLYLAEIDNLYKWFKIEYADIRSGTVQTGTRTGAIRLTAINQDRFPDRITIHLKDTFLIRAIKGLTSEIVGLLKEADDLKDRLAKPVATLLVSVEDNAEIITLASKETNTLITFQNVEPTHNQFVEYDIVFEPIDSKLLLAKFEASNLDRLIKWSRIVTSVTGETLQITANIASIDPESKTLTVCFTNTLTSDEVCHQIKLSDASNIDWKQLTSLLESTAIPIDINPMKFIYNNLTSVELYYDPDSQRFIQHNRFTLQYQLKKLSIPYAEGELQTIVNMIEYQTDDKSESEQPNLVDNDNDISPNDLSSILEGLV